MRGTEQLATRMGPPEDEERARIRDVLENVARPRLCGSEGAQAVDRYVRGELERLGYEVRELPFTFSRVPGRWGVPAAGLLLIIAGVLSAALAETQMRLVTISRYPGQLAMDTIIPVILAAMPMLLGRATAGASAAGAKVHNLPDRPSRLA